MCEYCGREECTLTKEQAIKRGAIIANYVDCPMRAATEETPMTYFFKGNPYYSLSAWFPDEEDENPHAYTRFVFDEDEGCGDEWEYTEIENPLEWQTEKEFLKKIGIEQ